MSLRQYLENLTGIDKILVIFEVGCQLFDILKLVHRSKRVYNDLKPENIMVDPPVKEGETLKIHLIDFGLAEKTINDLPHEPVQEGQLVDYFKGNIHYSTVNQMKFLKTSPRDDIISLFYLIVFNLNDKINYSKEF